MLRKSHIWKLLIISDPRDNSPSYQTLVERMPVASVSIVAAEIGFSLKNKMRSDLKSCLSAEQMLPLQQPPSVHLIMFKQAIPLSPLSSHSPV